MPRYPAWLTLESNEKIVWNPASLFSQCVAKVLANRAIDGYVELEEIAHLQFSPIQRSQPIKIIYKGDCTLLGCYNAEVTSSEQLHSHVERLGHYKLWNKKCRSSRKCIETVFPFHTETTVLNEINERKRVKRISDTKQFSCKRRLFE